MKKIALFLIILLAFGLRLYRLNAPLADWHSWRQSDTSAVSRNFVEEGIDLLHPRFEDLSNIPSGLENPEGYRFVEFPLYNLLQAVAFKTWPVFNLEVWGRVISIFFSLGSLLFLFFIAQKYWGGKTALLVAFFFAVLPFNIYYSRVILPEPMMLCTSLAMIFFFDRWLEKSRWLDYGLGLFSALCSFLLKPFTLVLLLPLVYLLWQRWSFNRKKWFWFGLAFFLALLPFVWWRWWMTHYPEGIPFSAWLFNYSHIRFRGAFFWWLFGERIGKLILGGWGLILLALGIIVKPKKKEGWFFHAWLAAILVYFVIVAGGNVQHDYYQILAIPIICLFLAKGSAFLITAPRQLFSKGLSYLLLLTSVLFMLAFSWYQIRDFFNINNPVILEAGQAVDRLVPQDAKVIAPYSGDTAFLYQTKRNGWPAGIEIEKMIKLGATYYVNINFDAEVDWLSQTYCVVEKTPDYIIIDLTRKCEFKE
jgi:4-amino-4-deoxy-L-arabinose transferase-like glycosyltransferase